MKRSILAAVAGVSALVAAAPAFAQPYGPPPAPAYGGGMNQPGPGYGPGPGYQGGGYQGGGYERDGRGGGDFWRGAPATPWERVQWLQQRIERGQQDGSLNPREAFRAKRELMKTREYARNARQRYGQLRPEDRDYIQQRLDYVSRLVRWERHNDR